MAQCPTLFPGATSLTTFSLENQKAMSYAVAATPAEIKDFYRSAFGEAGYRESAPNANIYQRGNQQFTLTVSPGVSERYVMLRLDTVPGMMMPPPPEPKAAPAAAPAPKK